MRITPRGRHMTQVFPGQSRRVTHALAVGSALLLSALFSTEAGAQALGYASTPQSAFPSDNVMVTPNDADESSDGSAAILPERLQRAVVNLDTSEPRGTV